MRLLNVISVLSLMLFLSLSMVTPSALAEKRNGKDIQLKREEFRIPYKSDEFLAPTFQNFEFILWRFGGYDIEDENDVLRFIALNDCKLFHRYMNYDLEWKNIQGLYKRFLEKNHESFPGRIRIRIPIGLKRFDEERSVFDLSEETQFDEIRILPVKRYEGEVRSRCKVKHSWLENFDNFILNDVDVSLKFPLTLKEIPVPVEKAREYIELVQRQGSYASKVRGRVAYAFYDIVLYYYIRRTNMGGHLLYGNIENVQIFANDDETFLLHEFDPSAQFNAAADNRGSAVAP
ncbi:MAG: DUF4852 domain-containing protein [Pseudomonadota bacterium]|nr:DUF4852 domain-containing protein [Pseudomonadota bacterium]